MSRQDLTKTGSTIAQEVLSALHLPGAVTLNRAIEAALKKRFDEGTNALIDELARAGAEGMEFGTEDHDEFIQMLLRFHESLRRGTTVRNLKLIAKILVGLKADGSFHFDEFSLFSRIVDDLTLDELKICCTLHESYKDNDDIPTAWPKFQQAMKSSGIDEGLYGKLGALTRSGLVIFVPGLDYGTYKPSPLMGRLIALADTVDLD